MASATRDDGVGPPGGAALQADVEPVAPPRLVRVERQAVDGVDDLHAAAPGRGPAGQDARLGGMECITSGRRSRSGRISAR